jgi:phospholipase C
VHRHVVHSRSLIGGKSVIVGVNSPTRFLSNRRAPRIGSRLFRTVPFLLFSVCCVFFTFGCASGSTNPAPVGTIDITASPATITAGSKATLTVSASNLSGVTVKGSDGSVYSLDSTGGSQAVSPAATTTYIASGTATSGTMTSKTTVTVNVPGAPAISISANPTAMTAGSSAILTVVAKNATAVAVTGSDSSKYTLSATGGTQAVSPAKTTTYTATATNAAGKNSATATLTVTPNPIPSVTVTATPASIYLGGSSALTVTASYATTVVLTGSDGTTYNLASTGGLQNVAPAATTTYTATATGAGGTAAGTATVTVSPDPQPSVSVVANPSTIVAGNTAFLTVAASNATEVSIAGSDGTSYTLSQATGGTQAVTPTATTTYTVTAVGGTNTTPVTAATTVQLAASGSVQQIDHVVFMLQENRSFDSYFGMLNPYREANGWNVGDDGNTYDVDGIDDKLTTLSNTNAEGTSFSPFELATSCIDDTDPEWSSSYNDVSLHSFTSTRPILMNGFVYTAEGHASACSQDNLCPGNYTDDTVGQRAMGYYDQDYLNYYYYMASQFALSDRWFSPISSYSINNRIATFSGGTTQGLVFTPGHDQLPQLSLPSIFQELDQASVSWKIYYTVTNGYCTDDDDCAASSNARYPATDFTNFTYSYRYVYENPSHAKCTDPTQPSSVVGDSTNSFCIDPTHIAPLTAYFTDVTNGTLPSFAFIEAGYGKNDEHPGSGQPNLAGQTEVANVVNALMGSYLWNDSVFFFSYDEGGGLYDHVPPVVGHSNANTDSSLGTIPDISSIAVNPDSYFPCLPPTSTDTPHCDLNTSQPGARSEDAPAVNGFAAQLGFRLPNIVISPFARKHYVSHQPMDHTAVIKFVENRFIGSAAHLTARDAAQPDLLDFFDFNAMPWATPPSPPTPMSNATLGYSSCRPATMR